ncbi:MAG TPA: DUF5060 domain-containing protein, partial [Bacteroidales bacterium]|nr:DUF5060 domain-containing protein [Bacteroidales bacterium]
MMRILHLFLLISFVGFVSCSDQAGTTTPKWGLYEITLEGPEDGNPFKDVKLSAEFEKGDRKVVVTGFYDGNGTYKVRFMPDETGTWTYTTNSNLEVLNDKTGMVACSEPEAGNHGPVSVYDTYLFRYADGTPYREVGTTSYAWIHQGDSLEGITLKTLASAPFNKLRMCIFPKSYSYNENEPVYYPFPRDSTGT